MRFTVISIVTLILISCGSDYSNDGAQNFGIVRSAIDIKSASGNYNVTRGNSFAVKIEAKSDDQLTELSLYLNDVLIDQPQALPLEHVFETADLKLGKNFIRMSAMSGEKTESKTTAFTILSDKKPIEYTYKVIKSYPHDVLAYTQGLIFLDGYLFEGTGQTGLSSLRKIELPGGKTVHKVDLDKTVFGEGITHFNDRIYQLTWNTKVGFIFNPETFEELGRFYYAGEGWGLTNNGAHLIKSDGTSRISFHDAADFREVDYIEACTDEGVVDKLNELEYIEGKIWANIWQTEKIVIIDPSNGMVEGIINLKGILNENERTEETDVLNGIAYDPESKKLIVTGKYWPKYFEIEIMQVGEKS